MSSSTTIAVAPVKTGREETAEAEAEPSGVSETLAETVTVSVPTSATQSEAVAIATAIGAHLADCAAARDAPESSRYCNRWQLSGRLGTRRLPREVVPGDEWKAAARSRW